MSSQRTDRESKRTTVSGDADAQYEEALRLARLRTPEGNRAALSLP